MRSWKASAFFVDDGAEVQAYYSGDGVQFTPAEVNRAATAAGEGDYDYLPGVVLTSGDVSPGTRYLKFEVAAGGLELSWVEIDFGERAAEVR